MPVVRNPPRGTVIDRGVWVDGHQYFQSDLVFVAGWLATANKATYVSPVPEPVGGSFYSYVGGNPTTSTTSKLIHTGHRYTFPKDVVIKGFKAYLVGGNSYEVYSVGDPLGDRIVTHLATLDPNTSGVVEVPINPVIAYNGQQVDLILSSREPDPTPVVFAANYEYITPNNVVPPSTGQIQHANKELSLIKVHKVDSDGVDQSGPLSALVVGDVIGGAGLSWAIQGIQDNSTWVGFSVAPAIQGYPTGTQEFSFETVSATPITYVEDTDYWVGNTSISGLKSLDGDYPSIVGNGNGYGVDILIQDFEFSPDWDIKAYSSELAGLEGLPTTKVPTEVKTSSSMVNWEVYSDTQYTEASPFSLFADVDTDLPNNGLSAILEFAPSSGSPLYDPLSGRFPGVRGRTIELTLTFKIKPTTGVTPIVDVWIDIGPDLSPIPLYITPNTFPKGNGVERNINYSVKYYQLDTWVANGMKIVLRGNTTFEVYDVTYNVFTP